VHDPDAASVARFRRFLGNAVAVDEGSLDAVCEASASLLLATTSPTPILDARRVAGAVFVASVGADADNLSELDPSVLPGRRIVSESRQNIHLGDLRRWRDAGRLAESDIVELRELVGEGGGIEEPGPGVVFISTGAALQDALVCDYLARGPEAGSGTGRAVPPASAARRPAASH